MGSGPSAGLRRRRPPAPRRRARPPARVTWRRAGLVARDHGAVITGRPSPSAPVAGEGWGPRWLRRLDAWASWAPSGRLAVPVIVALVLVANLVGVGTVIGFQLAVSSGAGTAGRTPVLLTVAAYLGIA